MTDPTHVLHALGARLAITRNELGLSQAAMAQALEMSARGYANYERGSRSIPVESLIQMHQLFSVDLNWILLGMKAARVEHDLSALKEFEISLDDFLTMRNLKLRSEKRAAIVERWYKSRIEGQEISTEELHNWIDLLAD